MHPNYLRAGVAGIIVGVVASFAMELAQQGLAALSVGGGSEDEDEDSEDRAPSTEEAAHVVAGVAGYQLSDEQRQLGGRRVHYATGTALGLAYTLAAERDPRIGLGAGLPLALGTMLVLDEIAVPAVGWGEPPAKAPASSHLTSLVAHLAFGLAAEGVRRLLRGASPPLAGR